MGNSSTMFRVLRIDDEDEPSKVQSLRYDSLYGRVPALADRYITFLSPGLSWNFPSASLSYQYPFAAFSGRINSICTSPTCCLSLNHYLAYQLPSRLLSRCSKLEVLVQNAIRCKYPPRRPFPGSRVNLRLRIVSILRKTVSSRASDHRISPRSPLNAETHPLPSPSLNL